MVHPCLAQSFPNEKVKSYPNIINFKLLKSTGNSFKIRLFIFKRVAYKLLLGPWRRWMGGYLSYQTYINRSVAASLTFGH